ncbi:hypothetical protein D187_008750 [Cystobacter fuscus DSM 2262]|uniref:DUF6884 domain-containing protein n=1 Tax=Cystobacter fuscus (strain ATCC 25194 / DSM 2262 / NBRC 100088 / M29) TaxID=1242864 RepID=S9PJH5_CYSF2|nr:DUF6884 domain-containing protein [Cystobacter fuscus]EPX62562.1 hypothetical protein D187_008750 [Cystobacter fuscus DSM 2262]
MSPLTPRRMALVGCGKEKLPRPAPARELYTGPLFRAALAVAEAEFGADVWILSAKHGLVDLDEDMAPYDLALGELSATERAAWARDVIRDLTDDDHGSPAHLTVYAGAPYVDALRGHLPRSWSLEDPLAGLGQGQRLSWLKGRLTQLSNRLGAPTPLTTSPAGPSGSALLESSVSAPRLTDEQREQHFHRGLALERALAELPVLKARFLEELARQEEALRAQHTRHFAAATTGEDPDARAEQQDLPLDAPASAQPTAQERSKPAPRKDAQPDPEPPTGTGRPRRRPATETKGEKRAGKAASARTATVAEASATSEGDEAAVPAPAVPCCTCGDSLADHTSPRGAIGACHAKTCPAKPRCQAFQLGRVLGWTLTWQGGWKETGGQPVFFLSQRETDVAKHGPLLSKEGGLVYADPVRLGRGTDVLEVARAKGEWSCVKGLRGVPLRVLEVVARVLAAPALERPAVPVSARERYLAETRERDPDLSEDEAIDRVERRLELEGQPVPAPPEFSGLDATALLDAHLGPREEGWEYKDELVVTGTDCACWACGTRTGPRARLSFGRSHRPRGVKTWRADKDSRCGAHWFSFWLCSRCCTPEVLAGKRQARELEAAQQSGDGTPSECDGCTSEFPASQLQPVGPKDARGFYCAECRAEIANTSPTPAAPVAPAPVDMFGRPWPAVDASLFPGWHVDVTPGFCGEPDSISAGRLHELFLLVDLAGPEGQRIEKLGWFPAAYGGPGVRPTAHTTPRGALATLLPAGLEPALVAYLSAHWPLPEETRRAQDVAAAAPMRKSRARAKTRAQREDAPSTPNSTAKPDAASCRWAVAEDLDLEVTDSGTANARLWVVPRGARGKARRGPLVLDAEGSLKPAPEADDRLRGWCGGINSLALRLRLSRFIAESKHVRAALALVLPAAPSAPAQASTPEGHSAHLQSTGDSWRVELPERLLGGSQVVPLWLVNEALGERRAASWWGRSGLKASHHYAGTLRGAALEEHRALLSWWKEHAETVVKPLAQACRDGAVPGLRVGVPAEPLAEGPFFYALSGGWRLEVWDFNEGAPEVHFTATDGTRHGPFRWDEDGLVASMIAVVSWASQHKALMAEAEDFIRRGFVLELCPEGVGQ